MFLVNNCNRNTNEYVTKNLSVSKYLLQLPHLSELLQLSGSRDLGSASDCCLQSVLYIGIFRMYPRSTCYLVIIQYSGCHWKLYKCCFMKQKCHFQKGVSQYRNASMLLSSLGIHTTHQHFQKRYITLFLLKGLKSYQPSKFESLYLLNKTHFIFLLWLITF